jgi:hypothetical protein
VTLTTGNVAVGGFQNDIIFDNTKVQLSSVSACRINPEIGLNPSGGACEDNPSVGPCKNLNRSLNRCGGSPQADGCPTGAGSNISVFRAIIAATAVPNTNPIPSGVMYTCTFTVLNPPAHLGNSGLVVANPNGMRLNAVALDGSIDTNAPPATPTPIAGAPRIAIESAIATGSTVAINVTLATDGAAVGGFQNDIIFDNTKVQLSGVSACRINPEIGLNPSGGACEDSPSVGPCKNLARSLRSCGTSPQGEGCPVGAGSNISVFRGVLAATAVPNTNSIPSGVMYTCTFSVVNPAALPAHLGVGKVVVAAPSGRPLASVGIDGVIETETVIRTFTPTGTIRTFTPTRTATVQSGTPIVPFSCGNGATTSGEECDDGGRCAGGANAGAACFSEDDCIGSGACFGGFDDLHGCSSDQECGLGVCRRCRPYGGDGCAANCTLESDKPYNLVPGVLVGVDIRPGTSGVNIHGPFLPAVPLPVSGTQVLTLGKTLDGVAPVAIRASSVNLDRIPVSTIACACVRGAEARTCGGTLYDNDGALSRNCTFGFPGAETCPADRACAAVHGPGNTGSGFIGCGLPTANVEIYQDCNGIPGQPPLAVLSSVEPLPSVADPSDGSAFLAISAAIGTVVGSCSGFDPGHGPDGQFCTDDDALANRGYPNPILLTTNDASGTVVNPGDFEGDVLGPFTTSGAPFTCDLATGEVSVSGANLAGVFTACDQPTVNDIVVPVNFAAQ